jgi:asparagine synthase (glutamine-hydrolysing)
MSDVPLGLFLSGASTRRDRRPHGAHGEGAHPHLLRGLRPRRGRRARVRAPRRARGRAEHREVVVSPAAFFQALPRLVWHEDEPIAFTSSVPLYFVSRLAGEHVKVVLTGEGADELFLGYNRYRVTAWNERLGGTLRGDGPGGAPGRRAPRRGRAARARRALRPPKLPRARAGAARAVLRELLRVPARAAARPASGMGLSRRPRSLCGGHAVSRRGARRSRVADEPRRICRPTWSSS